MEEKHKKAPFQSQQNKMYTEKLFVFLIYKWHVFVPVLSVLMVDVFLFFS